MKCSRAREKMARTSEIYIKILRPTVPRASKKRVYGQFSIETIHERRKGNREFSGFFFLSCLFE